MVHQQTLIYFETPQEGMREENGLFGLLLAIPFGMKLQKRPLRVLHHFWPSNDDLTNESSAIIIRTPHEESPCTASLI